MQNKTIWETVAFFIDYKKYYKKYILDALIYHVGL